MSVTQEYAIAAGHDNVAGLKRINRLEDSTGRPFPGVKNLGFSPGEGRVRADGTIGYAGFGRVTWFCGAIHWEQYAYLYSTILNNAYSGPVTIRTRLDGSTYMNRNAILTLPNTDEVRSRARWLLAFEYRFTRLEATS